MVGGALDWTAGLLGFGPRSATLLQLVRNLGTVVTVGVILWVPLRRADGGPLPALQALAVMTAAVVLLGPVVHLWYLLWAIPFFAVLKLSRRGRWPALIAVSMIGGLVAPLDSSLHGAYLAIVLGSMLVAWLVPVLLLTPAGPGADRRDRHRRVGCRCLPQAIRSRTPEKSACTSSIRSTDRDHGNCSARRRAAARRATRGRPATSSTASARAPGSGAPQAPEAASTSSRAPPRSAVTTGVPLARASRTASPNVSPGADRQRHVGGGDRAAQLGPAVDEPVEPHRRPGRQLDELVEVRAVAVHVQRTGTPRRCSSTAVATARCGDFSRESRPTWASRSTPSPARRRARPEGLEVDAERHPADRTAGVVGDLAELRLGVARGHHDRVEAAHQQPVEQP